MKCVLWMVGQDDEDLDMNYTLFLWWFVWWDYNLDLKLGEERKKNLQNFGGEGSLTLITYKIVMDVCIK